MRRSRIRRVRPAYCAVPQWAWQEMCDVVARRLEIQDDAQCRINAAHFVETKEPDALAAPGWVDRCGLLGKHPDVHASEFDLGAERSALELVWTSARPTRSTAADHLDNYGVAGAGLFVTAAPPRDAQLKDLTPPAESPG